MFPNKLFQKFCRERNVKESTKQGYESALKSYTQYHQESLNTLLDEAISEENQNIPLKNRKIKKRLLSYRSYLLKSKSSPNTVRTYFTKVKTFYRHFDKKANKEDLLKYKLHYEWKTYMDFHPEEIEKDKAGALFQFIYDNRNLFSLFYKNGLITTIMSIVEDFLVEGETYGKDYAYIMSYMIYGYFGIIYQWIKYGFDETPEQVFGHIQDAITSAAQKK